MASRRQQAIYEKVIGGRSDANLPFADLIAMLLSLGFKRRIRGDHHILWKDGITEIINLQPKNSKAKRYQVRQVRAIIKRHGLRITDE